MTSRDLVETQGKDSLLETNKVSGDVVEGGFFHADCCGWPLVKWLATIWWLLHVCIVFYLFIVFDCILLIEYVITNASHSLSLLILNLWFTGYLDV